ncbi:MAG: hypothetical protein AAF921_10955 [Cyanobacteria bacterium P01_D01_bin.44]
MSTIKIKFSYGDASAEIELDDTALSGTQDPKPKENSLDVQKCNTLESLPVNVIGKAQFEYSKILSNGNIAQADREAAAKSAIKVAAEKALIKAYNKTVGMYNVACPHDCNDVFSVLLPVAEKDIKEPVLQIVNGITEVFGNDEDNDLWTCSATQQHRLYYGCAKDIKTNHQFAIEAANQAAAALLKPDNKKLSRFERDEQAANAMGFHSIIASNGSKESLVWTFQPNLLNDAAIVKMKSIRVDGVMIQDHSGNFHTVKGELSKIVSKHGNSNLGEIESIRKFITENREVRSHLEKTMGKMLRLNQL